MKFNDSKGEDNKDKVGVIWDCTIYAKKLEVRNHLLSLYYLILWKNYLEEETI